MAAGYCLFHKKYLSRDEMKVKKCKCKANTKEKCKHLIITDNQKYCNNSNYISQVRR